MTHLEQLIQDLCPNGVPVVSIGDIVDNKTISMGRGNVISKKDLQEYPGEYPVYSSSAVGNGELGRYGKYMFEDERISWSIDGGGKFFYRNAEKYSVTNVCGWIKVINESLLSCKYLYYALLNEWSKKHYDYSHKAHPSVISKEYQIPLPPLAVQSEIVRVLDKFTLYKSELAAELAARLRQYEYYRDKLLTFDDTVKRVKLGEVAEISRGVRVVRKDLLTSGEIPVYQNSLKPLGYCEKYNTSACTTFVISAGAAGEIGYSNVDYWAADDCLRIIGNKVNNKYVYYWLLNNQNKISSQVRKASIPRLSKDVIINFPIPLPPLSEQERIVSILDRFDKLCHDIREGLPAEIDLRQKQYEHYRDRLLTFRQLGD